MDLNLTDEQRLLRDSAERFVAGSYDADHRRKMANEPLVMRGAPVRPLPRPNRVWGAGRVCAERGCGTRLSIYNRSEDCSLHELRTRKPPLAP